MQDDQPQPQGSTEPAPTWNFTADNQTPDENVPQPAAAPESVSWTASEFIAHAKSAGWYLILILVAAGGAGLAYLLTHGEIFTPGVIIVVAVLFGVMAARKPRELPYRIDAKGIHIGEKSYAFGGFKSFSVVQEEGVESIWLLPLQRFAPGLSIYFDPQDKARILEILDDFLPVEEKRLDLIDRLMHKIRF
jgi:hypothetical protein